MKKTKILFKKYKKLLPQGLGEPLPLFVKHASGSIVTDVEGRKFIDFTSGISAINLGHSNKKVIQAIHTQAKKFLHTAFIVAQYELYLEVAEKLIKRTPGKFAKKVFFANSGAEAVENAVKIARKATGRPAIISHTHGFHGRTLLTLSLTSKVKPYKFGFGPFAPEIYKLPYPYMYRRPSHCKTEEQYIDFLLQNIEGDFFKGVVDPETIAAIIIEPVTGEGGFIVAPNRYMQGLAEICKKYGILLIVDEIQTGFCRTGKWFAYEWSDVEPDLIVLAKSIASGMPLSAVVGRKEIMDSVQPGGLGGTFGGNPVCLAACKATIEEMQRLHLAVRAAQLGKEIAQTFHYLQKNSPYVGEARGRGAMWALEIVKDKTSKKPNSKAAKQLIRKMFDAGVLVLSGGMWGNVIRALPPLTMSQKELRHGLTIIEKIIMGF